MEEQLEQLNTDTLLMEPFGLNSLHLGRDQMQHERPGGAAELNPDGLAGSIASKSSDLGVTQ